jgi:signal transduction histidine kinase
LLTVHADDSITLQNNAARRLFGAAHVTRLNDLRQFGTSFARAVDECVPGVRELVNFTVEGVDYHLTLAVTEVTPVTSLARTASDLVDDVIEDAGPESPLAADLGDVQDAVSTVARRSDSLVQFIDSYRQITRLAPPEKKRVALTDLFDTITRLAGAEWQDDLVSLSTHVQPSGLYVYADRDLLEPVLLNLTHEPAGSYRHRDRRQRTGDSRRACHEDFRAVFHDA